MFTNVERNFTAFDISQLSNSSHAHIHVYLWRTCIDIFQRYRQFLKIIFGKIGQMMSILNEKTYSNFDIRFFFNLSNEKLNLVW